MGLKQSVVIVNEFSVPLPGGKGSRGATPGDYVTRYMARRQATEPLAPIQRRRTDDVIVRYKGREAAVARPGISRDAVKAAMRQAQGDGGTAFGYGSVSLSDEQLRAAAKDIQTGFENGKTVLKTVLSFSEDYLKEHGIIGPDFHCENRGDYRGHFDQMKLRMAITHGLDRMSAGGSGFDDLRWIGVIQIDTEHVHCHLAMIDAGTGSITKDGAQRGKLLDRHKAQLRRGIDTWLEGKQAVAHLSSAAGYERRNVTTFIKRWAHERINAESRPQFLLACLPADRDLWRANSTSARMRKANRLVTELVAEQLERAGSPWPAALEKILGYANQRRELDGLSPQDWQRLVDRGRRQIMERAVNGVYQMLRAVPEAELRTRTRTLEIMAMDYAQMALRAADRRATADDDLVSFGFRLRSYATRLRHHKDRAGVYCDLAYQWERAEKAVAATEDSRPLYDFYRFEEGYHRRVMAKYQHFLPFLGDAGQWHDQLRQVTDQSRRLLSLRALRQDASLQRMTEPARAEQLGRAIYDQPGGGRLAEGKAGRAVLDARIAAMTQAHLEHVETLRADLAASGLVLQGNPEESVGHVSVSLAIGAGVEHDFDEVKALDLHHLSYDFATDVAVGPRARRNFVSAAADRRRLLLAAMDYLDQSGQAEAIPDLPVGDVAAMTRVSRELTTSTLDADGADTPVLRSKIAALRASGPAAQTRRSAAPSLGSGLAVRVQAQIDAAVVSAAAAATNDSDSSHLLNDMTR